MRLSGIPCLHEAGETTPSDLPVHPQWRCPDHPPSCHPLPLLLKPSHEAYLCLVLLADGCLGCWAFDVCCGGCVWVGVFGSCFVAQREDRVISDAVGGASIFHHGLWVLTGWEKALRASWKLHLVSSQ